MGLSNVHQTDDRFGNAYTIVRVTHVTGVATTFDVDQSANSAAHLPDIGQTAGTVTVGAASAGLKTITLDSGDASGSYHIVVKHIGSAAGVGSHKPT